MMEGSEISPKERPVADVFSRMGNFMRGKSQAKFSLLLLLAAFIGIIAGLGAELFRSLIELFQGLVWPGEGSFSERVLEAPLWLRVGAPVLGGLVVGPIMCFAVPEAKGPGVPEVILAVVRGRSIIRRRVAVLKMFLTSFLIGCGASVGREGPVVQIGAAVGSSLAQLFHLDAGTRRVCLACGAAAGISATFNAPMAGTLFALEVILLEVEVGYAGHIVVAAVMGSVMSTHLWGTFPRLEVVDFVPGGPEELLAFLVLGPLAGLTSICFVRLNELLGDGFEGLPLPSWSLPAVGGLCLGLLGLFLPQVLGVGYEAANASLAGSLTLQAAAFLFFGKILATSFCVGSGMSGGIFAPSLVIGGALGSLLHFGLAHFVPQLEIVPGHLALVGMGAVTASTTMAPITAVLTIFELTDSSKIVLPLLISCITGATVHRLFFGRSVYESKLIRKGVKIVRGHDMAVLQSIRVETVMCEEYETMREDARIAEVFERMRMAAYPRFLVLDKEGDLVGVISLTDLKPWIGRMDEAQDLRAADLMSKDPVHVTPWNDLSEAFEAFKKKDASMLPVVEAARPKKLLGILKKEDLLRAYDEQVHKDRVLSHSPL
jgi:CIC family chloride channel protein